jgi:hypothetical protein
MSTLLTMKWLSRGSPNPNLTMRLNWRCVMLKCLSLLVSAMVIGVPAAGLAQFIDRGDHVEVKKGTRLCSSIAVDGVRGTLNERLIFWRVKSPMRVNGTQTASALVYERVYDRQSGETTTVENAYPNEDFATFFKREPEHNEMLQMISPRDGNLQAIVEVCRNDADALPPLQRFHDERVPGSPTREAKK